MEPSEQPRHQLKGHPPKKARERKKDLRKDDEVACVRPRMKLVKQEGGKNDSFLLGEDRTLEAG